MNFYKRSSKLISLATLNFKPDIFSACGIYRGNEFDLKPTLYNSQWDVKSGKSVLESALNLTWSYVVPKKTD